MNFKLSISILFIAFCIFTSCEKKNEEPKPASNTQPNTENNNTLTPQEAKSFLSSELTKIETQINAYTSAYTEANKSFQALKQHRITTTTATSGISYFYVPYSLTFGIPFSVPSAKLDMDDMLFTRKNNFELNNDNFISQDFENSKGEWFLSMFTTTNSSTINSLPSSLYSYCQKAGSSDYIYKYLAFKKNKNSDKLIISFPSNKYNVSSSLCNVDSVDNDLVYTVENLSLSPIIQTYVCINDIKSFTGTSNGISKLSSSITKGGNEICKIDINNSSFKTSFTSSFSGYVNTYLYSSTGNNLSTKHVGLEYNGTHILFDFYKDYISDNNSCYIGGSNAYGDYLEKDESELSFGEITIKGSADYKKAKKYLDSLSINSNSESAKIEEFINTIAKYEIYNKQGIKLGNFKARLKSIGGYSTEYYIINPMIVHLDGTIEEARKYITTFYAPVSFYRLQEMVRLKQ